MTTQPLPVRRERTPTEKINAVIDSFPCLRGFRRETDGRFDLDKWRAAEACRSHGEQLCMQFIACVWSGSQNEFSGTFDLFEFIGVADSDSLAAIIAWMQKPVWP